MLTTSSMETDFYLNFLVRFAGMLQLRIIKLIGNPDRILGCSGKKSNGWGFLFWGSRAVESPTVSTTVDKIRINRRSMQVRFLSFSTIKIINANHSLSVHSAISKSILDNEGEWSKNRKITEPNTKVTGCFHFFHGSFKPFCQYIKTAYGLLSSGNGFFYFIYRRSFNDVFLRLNPYALNQIKVLLQKLFSVVRCAIEEVYQWEINPVGLTTRLNRSRKAARLTHCPYC